LLVVNYADIETKINHFLSLFSSESKSSLHFIIGIPPTIGNEERLAQIIDSLHSQSEEITNLSKSEYFNFGTSLVD